MPERPTDVCGKRLHTILDCAKLIVTLDSRLRDLDGTVDGAQFDLDNLTQVSTRILGRRTAPVPTFPYSYPRPRMVLNPRS